MLRRGQHAWGLELGVQAMSGHGLPQVNPLLRVKGVLMAPVLRELPRPPGYRVQCRGARAQARSGREKGTTSHLFNTVGSKRMDP